MKAKLKILLLDDEENCLNSVQRILARLGHEVDCTTDPKAALQMIEGGAYDFALVDYMMPVHDGVWFMKNAHIPKTTKVLLMTAFVDRSIISQMFNLGARGYLIKPLEKDELIMHLEFHSGAKEESQ